MTQPPPSTPTPRRFLLSKRPPGSQQQTPGSGPPVFAGSQRFQPTPRFAPPSSTQRPPATPVFPVSLRPSRHRDPIHDALNSSPTDAPVSATRPMLGAGTQRQNPRIDIDSDAGSDSPSENEDQDELPPMVVAVNDSIEIESEPPSVLYSEAEERTPKRRRISVSPALSWHEEPKEDVAMGYEEEELVPGESEYGDEQLPDADDELPFREDAPKTEDDLVVPQRAAGDPVRTQPTFHRAPRFKPSESEIIRQEGLPEAFSPQRRGAKYVAGGLAAELQTWLAEVKGWTGGDRPADLVMSIAVDEVRHGNRMYLVRGRRTVGDGDVREEIAARLMLAGEGHLTGLGHKAPVIVGSVVAISQPAWEIELQDGRWIVACDWAVS